MYYVLPWLYIKKPSNRTKAIFESVLIFYSLLAVQHDKGWQRNHSPMNRVKQKEYGSSRCGNISLQQMYLPSVSDKVSVVSEAAVFMQLHGVTSYFAVRFDVEHFIGALYVFFNFAARSTGCPIGLPTLALLWLGYYWQVKFDCVKLQ